MKRIILVLFVVFATSCMVSKERWYKCEEVCKVNGGCSEVWPHNGVAYCGNGARFIVGAK